MGSTSYDEARDPSDASWSGASWYGPTSGEYWIINPREYADPRKHGPEYQSRARRMAADPSVSGTLEGDGPFVATPVEDASASDSSEGERWSGSASGSVGGETPAGRQAFATRSAASDPARGRSRADRLRRSPATPRDTPERRDPPDRPEPATATARSNARHHATAARAARHAAAPKLAPAQVTPGDAGWDAPRAAFGLPSRDWLGGSADDPIRRLGLALLAWPPLGLAAAAAIGDVTGCTSFSAACGGTDSLLPWLAQAGIVGLLLLLPAIARLLAGGSVGVLLALVPATAFLVVIGGSGAPQAGFALAFLLGIAWIAGVGWSVLGPRRRDPTTHGGGDG